MLTLTLKTNIKPTVEFDLRKKYILGLKSRKIPKKLKDEIKQVVNKMKESSENKTFGIVAANEVGIFKRIIYVDVKTARIFGIESCDGVALINPSIKDSEGVAISREETTINGETLVSTVMRPYKISVEYYTVNGKKSTIELEGRDATSFCQRYHLLDGILPKDLDESKTETAASQNLVDDYSETTKTGKNILKATYKIADMGTGCCAWKLENRIRTIPGVSNCSVSANVRTIVVDINSSLIWGSKELIEETSILKKIRAEIENFYDENKPYKIASSSYKLTSPAGNKIIREEGLDRVSMILGQRLIPPKTHGGAKSNPNRRSRRP